MRRMFYISLLLMMLGASMARADVVVIIRRQAEAAGNYVRISDVARIEGPKEQMVEVASVVLGPAPGRGESREFTRWEIEARLAEMGIASNVSFTGNEKVKVMNGGVQGWAGNRETREERPPLANLENFPASDPNAASPAFPRRMIGADVGQSARRGEPGGAASILDETRPELKNRLADVVSGYLAGQYNRPDVEIKTTLVSLSSPVPISAREIKVEEASGKIPGRATLLLSVMETPDSRPVRVTLSAEADVFALALVAARPIAKGETLSARDVKAARIKMASGNSYLPPRPAAADGLELVRNLAAGEAILAGDLRHSPAVKRGDLVQSVTSFPSRNSVWTVSASGKAMDSGMVGEIVTVEDQSTKVKYQARVTGRGTVSVLPKRK